VILILITEIFSVRISILQGPASSNYRDQEPCNSCFLYRRSCFCARKFLPASVLKKTSLMCNMCQVKSKVDTKLSRHRKMQYSHSQIDSFDKILWHCD